MSIEKEFANFLRHPAFNRIVQAWISKYQSLGYIGGRIAIDNLTEDEKSYIGGLLGLDLTRGKLSITYQEFLKKIAKTRFEGADFLTVLHLINGKPIQTKQALKLQEQELLEVFQNRLKMLYKDTLAYNWLIYYFETDHRHFIRNYREDKAKCQQVLESVCSLLNQLPCFSSDFEQLAILAQKFTNNPHFFDEESTRDLLRKGISYLLEINEEYSTNEILNQAGILRDELSNFCYICHIEPQSHHSSWHQFYVDYEPWNMNMYNLVSLKGGFCCQDVYILENPSVFFSLLNIAKENALNIGLISSNGQINGCTYLLLERLVESGCHLYYAGDFDPEGLVIADKLKQRYGKHLDLWLYESELYDQNKMECKISYRRMAMLDGVKDKKLINIAEKIKGNNALAYQEGLICNYARALFDKYKIPKK